MTRVLYDISPVSPNPAHRTGLARVTLRSAELLACSQDIQARFTAVGSVSALVGATELLAPWPKEVAALPRTEFAKLILWWEQSLAQWQGGGLLARLGGRVVRDGLRALNLVRNTVPSEALRWADIFHSSYARVPSTVRRSRHLGVVVTIHDLTPLVLSPDCFPSHQAGITRRIMRSVIPTDWVIAVSRSTLDDFFRYTGHPADRATVIPWAADPSLFYPCVDPDRVAKVRTKYRLPSGRYVLSLSSLSPHKNVAHLARCAAVVAEQQGCDDLTLVLAGNPGEHSLAWLTSLNPAIVSRVHLAGYVEESDLAPLYSGAAAFAFPSLYEGFGLPVLEAMQCGVPVIASNTSSLPEIVGDAGILALPTDQQAWIAALTRLLTDEPYRLDLARRARARAMTFTWERTIAETIAVYARAAEAMRGK